MCHMYKGFGAEASTFFRQLEADNSKDFWATNRHRYDDAIKPTFLELLTGIGGFGPWRVYRPNNDTRFGNSKGAYKTFIGGVAGRPDGVGAFVQISPKGLLIGTGNPMPAPDQLTKLREAIADQHAGSDFLDAISTVRHTGATVHGGRWDPLKRVPTRYPSDHRLADYLKWKGVEINHRPGTPATPAWLDKRDAPKQIAALIETGNPLHDWLATHVGPTALTPEERFAPKSATGRVPKGKVPKGKAPKA
jgi:uncharacterized protein (DUF2461 family)